MRYSIIILSIFLLGMNNPLNITYVGSLPVVEFKELSCNTEQELIQATMLVNSEARGESLEGQKEVFGVLLSRKKHDNFANTLIDVIYEKGQFDGINNKYFKYEKDLYDNIKKWYFEDYTSNYLFYYNPVTATDTIFINWSMKFKRYDIGNHRFF